MGSALMQLDRALDHVSGIRADVGARLSRARPDGRHPRATREVDLKSSISQLRDLDYAEAITQPELQSVGLQAAQASYAKLAQISLFDYL